MNRIIIEKECGCFTKSDLKNNSGFESKDDALMKAMSMVNHMNTEFCNKHDFQLSEDGDNFFIAVDEAQKQSGCCGGGHCSS